MGEYNLSTEQIVGLYTLFLLAASFILFSYVERPTGAGQVGAFIGLCVSAIGLVACTLVEFFTEYPGLHLLIENVSLILISFWVSAQCLFSYWFYRSDYKVPVYLSAVFFGFPLVFALSLLYFAAVELYHLVEAGAVLSAIDFAFPQWERWASAADIYAQILIVGSVLVVLAGHIRSHRFNKVPSFLVMTALSLTVAGAALKRFEANPTNLDTAIVTTGLALVLYHLAISSHGHNFYARYARLAAFRFLKDFVVVFDKRGQVADFNPSADKWFSSIGIDLRKFTFASLNEHLKKAGAVTTPTLGVDKGSDISFTHNGLPVVLNMQIFDLSGGRTNRKHGTIVFFFDVTQNRQLFDKLEKKAGVDALSGLPNRTAYEGAKARYDREPGHLPLSVVACDLNGLKAVNDKLGHKYGDLLIQTAAKVCGDACQQANFVARIGGDEFVFLLSQTDEEQAGVFIAELKATMAECSKTLPFTLSMAMGSATKCRSEDLLETAVDLADKRMYQDKKVMKGAEPR